LQQNLRFVGKGAQSGWVVIKKEDRGRKSGRTQPPIRLQKRSRTFVENQNIPGRVLLFATKVVGCKEKGRKA